MLTLSMSSGHGQKRLYFASMAGFLYFFRADLVQVALIYGRIHGWVPLHLSG